MAIHPRFYRPSKTSRKPVIAAEALGPGDIHGDGAARIRETFTMKPRDIDVCCQYGWKAYRDRQAWKGL